MLTVQACKCSKEIPEIVFFISEKSYSAFADEVVTSHGPIEADKENIRQEPYSLPQGFMWDTLDLSNADVVSTVFVPVT